MSKAEEFAIKKYPVSIEDIHGHKVDVNLWQRKACVDGYHQAEKDNELTWKDMECIIKHYQDIMAEKSRVFVRVEDYQELLKRFKKLKENNEKKIETHGENYMTILR